MKNLDNDLVFEAGDDMTSEPVRQAIANLVRPLLEKGLEDIPAVAVDGLCDFVCDGVANVVTKILEARSKGGNTSEPACSDLVRRKIPQVLNFAPDYGRFFNFAFEQGVSVTVHDYLKVRDRWSQACSKGFVDMVLSGEQSPVYTSDWLNHFYSSVPTGFDNPRAMVLDGVRMPNVDLIVTPVDGDSLSEEFDFNPAKWTLDMPESYRPASYEGAEDRIVSVRRSGLSVQIEDCRRQIRAVEREKVGVEKQMAELGNNNNNNPTVFAELLSQRQELIQRGFQLQEMNSRLAGQIRALSADLSRRDS